MHSTELGINFLAMQMQCACSMISPETTSLSTSVKVLSCRLRENISIAYTRYSSLVLMYLCVFCDYKSCLHNWAYTSKRVLRILQMRGDMDILFHQSMISFRLATRQSLIVTQSCSCMEKLNWATNRATNWATRIKLWIELRIELQTCESSCELSYE